MLANGQSFTQVAALRIVRWGSRGFRQVRSAGQNFVACRDPCARQPKRRAEILQPIAHRVRFASKVPLSKPNLPNAVLSDRKDPHRQSIASTHLLTGTILVAPEDHKAEQRSCRPSWFHRNAVIRGDASRNRPESVLFDHQTIKVHFVKVTARRFLIWSEPRFGRSFWFRRCVEQTIVICASR